MPSPPPGDTKPLVATSILLQRLHNDIPLDHFTLGWLMHSLHKRSFGIITLLLALVAIAPGLSIIAGLLLMIPAFQMIIGSTAPVFPRRIAAHPLPTKYLAAVLQRSVPVLRYLEHVIHPRWHTPIEVTKRTVGFAVSIDMQDDLRDFPPVGSLAFRLQKSRVRDDMLLVIGRHRRFIWRYVCDVGIYRRIIHRDFIEA